MPRARTLSTDKKVLFATILLLVLLFFVWLAAEMYLRSTSCLGSASTKHIYRAHPQLGWVGRPGATVRRSLMSSCEEYRYNNDGFRGPDRTPAKAPGTLRVVVLGDSFLEGYQFADDELLTAHLEKMLTARLHRPVEVINMGLAGWTTPQQYMAYQVYGRQYDPDLVVLLFSSCNDVAEASRKYAEIYSNDPVAGRAFFTLNGDQLEFQPPLPGFVETWNTVVDAEGDATSIPLWVACPPGTKLFCMSRVVYWLVIRWNRPSPLRMKLHDWRILPYNNRLFTTTWGEHGLVNGVSLRFWIYLSMPDAEWQNSLRVVSRLIDELRRQVEKDGARFLLVSGANIEQAHPEIWELTLRSQPRLKWFDFDLNLPEKYLWRQAMTHSWRYLPLRHAFAEAAKRGEELFLRSDGHWNEDGQRYAAEIIGAHIVDNGLLAPPAAP
jgi:hypothetical protein